LPTYGGRQSAVTGRSREFLVDSQFSGPANSPDLSRQSAAVSLENLPEGQSNPIGRNGQSNIMLVTSFVGHLLPVWISVRVGLMVGKSSSLPDYRQFM
jgi:hypothetical protein